jgi:hypothetical protein
MSSAYFAPILSLSTFGLRLRISEIGCITTVLYSPDLYHDTYSIFPTGQHHSKRSSIVSYISILFYTLCTFISLHSSSGSAARCTPSCVRAKPSFGTHRSSSEPHHSRCSFSAFRRQQDRSSSCRRGRSSVAPGQSHPPPEPH